MSNSYRKHVEGLLEEAKTDITSQELLRILLRNEAENAPIERIIQMGHFLLTIKDKSNAKLSVAVS